MEKLKNFIEYFFENYSFIITKQVIEINLQDFANLIKSTFCQLELRNKIAYEIINSLIGKIYKKYGKTSAEYNFTEETFQLAKKYKLL